MTKRPKLMVVDNEIDICNFVKMFFESRSFDVVIALNGDEAMSKLLHERPDIVMLDMMMRRGDEGLEYLPQIKAALPAVKVIMVTGIEDEDIIAKAQELGTDDYITKPLILEYLENTVMAKIRALEAAKF